MSNSPENPEFERWYFELTTNNSRSFRSPLMPGARELKGTTRDGRTISCLYLGESPTDSPWRESDGVPFAGYIYLSRGPAYETFDISVGGGVVKTVSDTSTGELCHPEELSSDQLVELMRDLDEQLSDKA